MHAGKGIERRHILVTSAPVFTRACRCWCRDPAWQRGHVKGDPHRIGAQRHLPRERGGHSVEGRGNGSLVCEGQPQHYVMERAQGTVLQQALAHHLQVHALKSSLASCRPVGLSACAATPIRAACSPSPHIHVTDADGAATVICLPSMPTRRYDTARACFPTRLSSSKPWTLERARFTDKGKITPSILHAAAQGCRAARRCCGSE